MINALLITNTLEESPSGGRQLLCKLNHDALKEIYGEGFILHELPRHRLQGVKSILNAFKGYLDGLDDVAIGLVLTAIQSKNIEKVFVDGSNLGGVVKIIKKKFPEVEVSTFFHNVEARFFLGAWRQKKTLRSLAVLIVNYFAERKAVKYSDKIICLNERDSLLLNKIYGRKATHLSAMALQDKRPTNMANTYDPSSEKFALFIGGDFYANREGITWFVEHVVPRINIKTYIVGRGFEKLKVELERDSKVVVVGAVDSLSEWYQNAHFVIAPIFDGSGMKTKVAEAMMYGKKIVGTPEAFSGYEDIAIQVGWLCRTADEFVVAIAEAKSEVDTAFDMTLRVIYLNNYSFPAARERLHEIMEN